MLGDGERWRVDCADCLPWLQAMPDRSVDLIVTSPPYSHGVRRYNIGFRLKAQAWIDWLIPRIMQGCRVSASFVCVNVSAPVRDWQYTGVVEWLYTDLTRNCGLVCGPAPYVYHKRGGTPGSGRKHYHRR